MRWYIKLILAAYAIVFAVTWIVCPPVGFPMMLGTVSGGCIAVLLLADFFEEE